MDKTNRRVELAEEIAKNWNSVGIQYAVVHGLKDYPKKLGRDIDLIIQKSDACTAMNIAIEIGKSLGFSTHLCRWSEWGLYQLVLINKETRNSLPLDFICTAELWQAKFINFMTQTKFKNLCHGDSDVGFFRVSNEGTFIKACLRPLVCGDLRRFGELEELSGKEEFTLPVKFPEELNKKDVLKMVGTYGLTLLELPHKSELESAFPMAIYRLQAMWLIKNPVIAFKNVINGLRRHILMWLLNSSPIILIKTNQSIELIDYLAQAVETYKKQFVEIRLYSYKCSFLRRLAGYFYGWRFKPVSEFNLSIVVQQRTNHIENDLVSRKLGRWSFQPDYEIELSKSKSVNEHQEFLNKTIFALLEARNSYVNCCVEP